ncbi:putative pre-nudix hydrolase domain-containing protein [Helianthus annuus]|nr:putative pre-nudix hydrolase domain-containing protein [Helianthus annuus]
MIIRFLPKPASILCFLTTTRSISHLRPNLFHKKGRYSSSLGIRLNVRSVSGSAGSSSAPSNVLSVRTVGGVLIGKEDEHGGVIVEMDAEPVDPVVFVSLLKASMLQWKQQVVPVLMNCV